jgi:NADH:ubiquinone oxidoreductase subunit H
VSVAPNPFSSDVSVVVNHNLPGQNITATIEVYDLNGRVVYRERKVAAIMQDRIGPNRSWKFGLLQPLADGGKFFFKEDFIPEKAEKFLFFFGPGLVMFISLITGAVIPWGKSLNIGGQSFDLQVANLDVGVLYLMGMVSIGVYGIMIGGWASNNKFALIGAIRASSQMISYELAMGLQLVTHFLIDVWKGRMNGWFPALRSPSNKGHWIVFGLDQLLHTLVIIGMALYAVV